MFEIILTEEAWNTHKNSILDNKQSFIEYMVVNHFNQMMKIEEVSITFPCCLITSDRHKIYTYSKGSDLRGFSEDTPSSGGRQLTMEFSKKYVTHLFKTYDIFYLAVKEESVGEEPDDEEPVDEEPVGEEPIEELIDEEPVVQHVVKKEVIEESNKRLQTVIIISSPGSEDNAIKITINGLKNITIS